MQRLANRVVLSLVALALSGASLRAQCASPQGSATLGLDGHLATGNSIAYQVVGLPLAPGALVLDVGPGPNVFSWGTICLDLGPLAATYALALDSGGAASIGLGVPPLPGLAGLLLCSQAVVLDASAPNGAFALSNGLASTITGSSVLFQDDFESYPTGGFPSGGWVNFYGSGLGRIVAAGDQSPQSLELVGATCWSDVAYRPVAMTPRVRFEVSVYPVNLVGGGCGPDMLNIGFAAPPPNCTWGCAYDFIQFAPDGFIYVWGQQGGIQLQAFTPGRWYHVAIIADFTQNTFDVEIDGVLFAGLAGNTSGVPPGVSFYAGHGAQPVARFDSVRVLQQ